MTTKGDELPEEQEIPHVVLGDEFAAGLSYDFPDAMIQITGRQLKKWGVSFDTVYKCALENLKKRSDKPLVEAVNGVYISNWQDGYDASRILLTDMIAGLPLTGAPVVMMPSAENLVITGADDVEGLASVLNVIEPMPISLARWLECRWCFVVVNGCLLRWRPSIPCSNVFVCLEFLPPPAVMQISAALLPSGCRASENLPL